MRTPHCSGFSCCRAQAAGAQASVVVDSIPGEGTKVPQAEGCGHFLFFFSFLKIDICIEMTAESYAAIGIFIHTNGLPWWLRWLSILLQRRRPGFDSWVGKSPWRREWQPTPVFLPGEFHPQRSLVGYSPWCHRVRHD